MMKRFCAALLVSVFAASAIAADRMVLLITPGGVFQSSVSNGIPGPWVSIDADVIVQGFTPGGGGGDVPPKPPANDPIVEQVRLLAVKHLKDKQEAVAVAAIIDSLSKLSGANFAEALAMAAPIADASLKADGRIVALSKAMLLVTPDPAKLKAGVQAAFGITGETLAAIDNAVKSPEGAAVEAEALDFMAIIAMIKMILELLKSLGII